MGFEKTPATPEAITVNVDLSPNPTPSRTFFGLSKLSSSL